MSDMDPLLLVALFGLAAMPVAIAYFKIASRRINRDIARRKDGWPMR
ncbi:MULTISPECIES: hypothetical protein [unclassified Aureimonas]|nr:MULTISPECIES: hypothetical protein [unclassified Aureimonas]ALN75653.1 hypothetical protein M673_23190 [Aureimonas sp. AU20]